MKILTVLIITQLVILIYVWIRLRNLQSKVSKAQKKNQDITGKKDALLYDLYLCFENKLGTRLLPPALKDVPFADKAGIVLSVKTISVPSIPGAFNPSIGNTQDGYLLFFRFDTPIHPNNRIPFSSRIGYIELDKNFIPIEKELALIKTGTQTSEDPRFFQSNGLDYLIFNDLTSNSSNKRCLQIGQINSNTKTLNYITSLTLNSEITEKNWTPFSSKGEIYLIHTISPQKLFKLSNTRKNHLSLCIEATKEINWPKMWGSIRGGTPAQLVDGEYLAFFHSSFEDSKGILWYVMGAYTFKDSYPFEITRISPHPILFEGIYNTIHQYVANPKVRAIYPSGFVCEQRGDEEVIHLSCGENDSGIKVVSFDKKELLASLKNIESNLEKERTKR